jgi:pantoate--beta-alanine ligase
MRIVTTVKEMQSVAAGLRQSGKQIGLVPTMGYLHAGHLSLVNIARSKSDAVIMTIFVNPAQFGPSEDFNRYPRDIENDTKLAESAGVDVLFVPETAEMYPRNYFTSVEVEKLTTVLEGSFRPTHFRGVTTIVAKLFNLTRPDVAVFGQKDAQQAVVIQRMAKDLNYPIEIIIGPIIREKDGLAMSSRNVYLSESEREESTVLNRSLQYADLIIRRGERQSGEIISEMKSIVVAAKSAIIEYISIADPETLNEIPVLSSNSRVLISMAVKFGKTRLIDNLLITIP